MSTATATATVTDMDLEFCKNLATQLDPNAVILHLDLDKILATAKPVELDMFVLLQARDLMYRVCESSVTPVTLPSETEDYIGKVVESLAHTTGAFHRDLKEGEAVFTFNLSESVRCALVLLMSVSLLTLHKLIVGRGDRDKKLLDSLRRNLKQFDNLGFPEEPACVTELRKLV